MTTAFDAEALVFQTAAAPNGSHGLTLGAINLFLPDIAATASTQTLYTRLE